ncbi:hypothetical protein M911_11635 [Ectothiorhodospira haloalkaliphila]|uniref:DUF4214 domain-containing protein n=1 Tax=Ectothiorhodospira haloalkaliphila TaxID=421628 RepID=W8KYV4_9GAMM|nr:hypothetical protein [Ectothiorhodospira haloalkaliphila]AHK80726.1 hypothetical protein M911_11635 [Ectothiorhodospira haloalkaliphila]
MTREEALEVLENPAYLNALFSSATEGLSSEELVESAYSNLLGLDRGEAEFTNADARIDWWVGELDGGRVSSDEFASTFLNAALTSQGSLVDDEAFALNGVRAPVAVAAVQQISDDNAGEQPADAAAALAGVKADVDAVDPVDPEDPEVPGQTFTLTADADDLTGTANDDVFNAPLNLAGAQTLNTNDRLDGNGGTNTLNATLTNSINLEDVFENIQNVFIRAVGNVNPTVVNMTDIEGLEQIWNDRSTDGLTVNSIENVVTVGVIRGSGEDFTVLYANVGDAVEQNMVFDRANINNLTIANFGDAEVVNIDLVGGDSTFDSIVVTGADLEVINISGGGNLEIDDAAPLIAGVIDASSATGNLEFAVDNTAVVLPDGVEEQTVKLGSGDDVLDITNINIDADDISIDGGAGRDMIIVDGANASLTDNLLAKVKNFEVLNLDGLNQSVNWGSLTTIGYEALVLTDSAAGAVVNGLTQDADLTLVDSAAATLELNVAGASQSDDTAFGLKVIGDDQLASTFDFQVDNVQDLNVEVENTSDRATHSVSTLTITGQDADGNDTLENLTITGDEAVLFDGSGIDSLKSVDVSGISVRSSIDAGNYAANIEVGDGVTVTGSSGDDMITAGFSTVTGGEGKDTFVVADGSTDLGKFTTITDFSDGDVIDFGTNVTGVFEITEDDLGLAPGVDVKFEDFVNAAVSVSGADGDVSYFEFGGDTYLVQNSDGSNNDFLAADIIVKLVGVVDLSDLEATDPGVESTVAFA